MATSPLFPWRELLQYLSATYPGRHGVEVKIILDRGKLVLPVPDAAEVGMVRLDAAHQTPGAIHSDDFRSVNWFGETYGFTEPQAAVVKVLWSAWEKGIPDVADKKALAASGSAGVKLADVFRESPAWGPFIGEGSTRGTHRLVDPADLPPNLDDPAE